MNKLSVILGDAIDKLKGLEAKSVDLIIADPSYNLGKNYGNGSEQKCFDSYLEFSKLWLTECDLCT